MAENTFIAVHRIERRPNKTVEITIPGDPIVLDVDADETQIFLKGGAIRELRASEINTGSPDADTNGDGNLSVAEIKAAAEDADLATLEAMLAEEEAGKNRKGAVSALNDAIEAIAAKDAEVADDADEGNPEL